MMMTKKRIKIGDIFQILTSEGVCYGLVTHKNKKWDWIVVIFREFYNKTPKDFTEIVSKKPFLITPFVIQTVVNDGLFSIVANIDLPADLKDFPIFKATNNFKGDDTMWFFWDGTDEYKVHRPLTAEEKKYPIGPSLPSAPLLIDWIQKN